MDCVITGHIGRKATAALKEARVRIFLGASGPVNEVLESFKNGTLEEKI